MVNLYDEKQSCRNAGLFYFSLMKYNEKDGFTLIELVISVAIMVTLSAIFAPNYARYNSESHAKTTEANMASIKQAFINHFYLSVLDRSTEFPPAPADSVMDDAWGSDPVLYNGKTPVSLFSKGFIPKNSYGEPFLYALLSPTAEDQYGFFLKDAKSGLSFSFRP